MRDRCRASITTMGVIPGGSKVAQDALRLLDELEALKHRCTALELGLIQLTTWHIGEEPGSEAESLLKKVARHAQSYLGEG